MMAACGSLAQLEGLYKREVRPSARPLDASDAIDLQGIEKLARPDIEGFTPMHWSALCGHTETVRCARDTVIHMI